MEPSQAPPASSTSCRVCGGPAGSAEECPACEQRLTAYLSSLVAELSTSEKLAEAPGELRALADMLSEPPAPAARSAPPALPAPILESSAVEIGAEEPDTAEPAATQPLPTEPEPTVLAKPSEATEPRPSAAPPRRRGRRTLIAAVALGALATAGTLAVSQGDPGETSPPPEPKSDVADRSPAPAPTPSAEPRTEPVGFATWGGPVRILYEDGMKDRMKVTLEIGPLEPGKRAGRAISRQNDTVCQGPLTSLGRVDGVFRFAYRERNTAECIAKGRITLTPAGERLAFKEVTPSSVNRGFLTRK